MKRIGMIQKIMLLVIGLLAWPCAKAQVVVENRLDSTEILIGQQVRFQVKVTANAGQFIEFPRLKGKNMIPGVEVVDITAPDTSWLNNRKRMCVERTYLLTSFDSALYFLPPISVTVGGKRYAAAKGIGLKVNTVAVDTTKVDRYFGPRADVEGVFVWSPTWFLLSVLLVILFTVAVLLIYRSRSQRPMVRRKILPPPLPPHQIAQQEIEKIKSSGAASRDDKAYYMELTDVLRTYIEQRFGFNAGKMTSAEIISHLMQVDNAEALRELRQIFETADLVKFAKHHTHINENDANLLKAVAFINSTKLESKEPPKPIIQEIPVAQKRQMALKLTMLIGGIAVAAAAVILLYYIGIFLYQTFM